METSHFSWTTIQLPGFYRIGKLVVYVLKRVMISLNQTIDVDQTKQKLMQSFTYEDYHSCKSNKFPQPILLGQSQEQYVKSVQSY